MYFFSSYISFSVDWWGGLTVLEYANDAPEPVRAAPSAYHFSIDWVDGVGFDLQVYTAIDFTNSVELGRSVLVRFFSPTALQLTVCHPSTQPTVPSSLREAIVSKHVSMPALNASIITLYFLL